MSILPDRIARILRVPRLPRRYRPGLALTLLALVLAVTEPRLERYGDNLQIALPLVAWGCEAMNGSGPEYLLRYLVMLGSAHSAKAVLGDASVNQRPNGGISGMPSAHTSTAVLGASSLAQTCLTGHPVAQGAVILGAGVVGVSRVETGWHSAAQVIWGAVLGWVCDRAFRRNRRVRMCVHRRVHRLAVWMRLRR